MTNQKFCHKHSEITLTVTKCQISVLRKFLYKKVILEGILLGREIPNPKVSKNLADDLLLETLLRTKPVTSLK